MKQEPESLVPPFDTQLIVRRYDAIAGLFTAILMQLQAASDLPSDTNGVRNDCLARAEELARKGLRQVRELVEMVRLNGGGDEDTLKAMRALVNTVAHSSSALATFEVRGSERSLKISTGITLRRILPEALRNAQRYAHAQQIKVQLCFEEERLVLEIDDDGNGFAPEDLPENGSGFGLLGMRTLVERLGGCFTLRSAPGEGTQVRVDLPHPYVDGCA